MTLFARHPVPWRVQVHEELRDHPEQFAGGYLLYDANGDTILFGGTYSGDGDEEQNLKAHEVVELMQIVNINQGQPAGAVEYVSREQGADWPWPKGTTK